MKTKVLSTTARVSINLSCYVNTTKLPASAWARFETQSISRSHNYGIDTVPCRFF